MNKILDNDYYDLIINNVSIPSYENGENITFLNVRHSLLHIPKEDTDPCNLGRYPYHSFPTLYTPTSTISLEKSGIGEIQKNPYLNLFGRGILIGVLDTGIDYQHPAFQYKDGSSRIYSIWDQTIQDGSPPAGFTFGTEYRKELINIAMKSEEPLSVVPVTDTLGHGTAIASIIAGTPDASNSFSGVVPESELIVVKLKEAKQNLKDIFFVPEDVSCYQESDIILGIQYLDTVSQYVNRPLVICVALGSSFGGHDGSGALTNHLNQLALYPGKDVVVSAGNEGNRLRHYFDRTDLEPYYNDFELKVGEKDKSFSMEIYSYALGLLTIEVSSPNGESTKTILPTISNCKQYKFIFIPTLIWVNNFTFEEETADQMILIRFDNLTSGIWKFRVQSIKDEPLAIHSWLPSGNLISNDTFFLNANPDTTITSPGNGTNQLTVAAYNQLKNSILPESGRGYTRAGMVKPDIAAPGFQLTCALPGNRYGMLTGTGAAAAHTTGAVAMIMEWAIDRGNYTTITGNNINYLIMRGARREVEKVYPNNIWGYGQLDILGLFQQLTNL